MLKCNSAINKVGILGVVFKSFSYFIALQNVEVQQLMNKVSIMGVVFKSLLRFNCPAECLSATAHK